ncbi:hypothetical protein HPP92_004824 [Vanilla planifolia]|uniref:Uncharacterized protein n=1 Tax=Vanilla planifolia TaxID=51239 RepID=A0A835RSX2_VANPL|nr:hypothetical protein HPP92_004824 [Vanilla planifolia]
MGGDAAPRPGPRRSDRSGLLRSTPIPDKPSIFHLAFSFDEGPSPFDADAILDIGNRLGRASADFSACLSGMAQQFFRQIPSPFRQDDGEPLKSNPSSSPRCCNPLTEEVLGSLHSPSCSETKVNPSMPADLDATTLSVGLDGSAPRHLAGTGTGFVEKIAAPCR